MKRKLLYTFITAILLVPLYGVQAMAQDYKLPDNTGFVKMDDIFRENSTLKEMKIYGDLQRNDTLKVKFYGGENKGKLLYKETYESCNQGLIVLRDDVLGLIFISKGGETIKELKLYSAKPNNGWSKDQEILFRIQERKNEEKQDSVQTEGNSTKRAVDRDDYKSVLDSKYVWLIYGVLGSLALFFLLFYIKIKRNNPSKNVGDQSSTPHPYFPETKDSLSKKDIEQIVEQIIKKNNSEIIDEFGKKIEAKFVSLKNEFFGQDKMPSKVPVRPRTVQIDKKVIKSDVEEFCGYAQLPQNGDFALTLTQDPTRTAFVISKRGSDYFVGLIDDEQTLSQLVQPLSDLKANGSNIVDFPEGELQGAQKIVCVDRGTFKEESTGRIIPVKPIQIKRG